MAIAGSSTTAYRCWLDAHGNLRTSDSRIVGGDICIKPKTALGILRKGQPVIVAGSDMMKLRALLEALNA